MTDLIQAALLSIVLSVPFTVALRLTGYNSSSLRPWAAIGFLSGALAYAHVNGPSVVAFVFLMTAVAGIVFADVGGKSNDRR